MEKEEFNLEVVRTDKVKVEFDPEYFDEEWFENFRKDFYDFYTLGELAEYIACSIVSDNETFVEGVGVPLTNGKPPYWITKDRKKDVNNHVNVLYNIYSTGTEVELI